MKKIGLIHTSATLVPVFQQLFKEKSVQAEVFNIVDDSLIKDVIEKGRLEDKTAQRVINYVKSAEDAGADLIVVTCSSIGRAVEQAAEKARVPVLRVDQPMTDRAVAEGKRIGVVATLPTTLEPTSDLVLRRAQKAGKEVTLVSRLCDGAFEALMNGDADKHDEMVRQALQELSEQVDVILLAQASMARVVSQIPESEQKVPIFSSPGIAVDYVAALCNES
ncbi:aspartate/glutamate racemase family protein [Sphingobacterium chuzhouense]|uniref:Aspartate/glutamate racemase family protein n=1 Tax=Sphingobacterium chuzhouense TaxID=1742264 RepID=A0ABR7XMZ1_9SPHI|nr:aspartate/glutamate racemase family protein [Sphingobacterium chuzhouense]MBD1420534.1 aspartate/glutamate racemase family protein [Sphingobacterium chuzhouense]